MPRTAINVFHFGKPAIREIFHAEQELDNAVDKFAVKVIKTTKQLPFTVQVLANFVVFYRTWWKNSSRRHYTCA